MNGTVFRHAWRRSARTSLLLALGLGLFYWVVLLSSSSFAGDAATAPPVLLKPPRAMTAFVGGASDFLHADGWLAAGMFHPVVLAMMTIGAMLVPSTTGATELERGTLDLVLSRPVSRGAFLAAKAVASLALLTVVTAGGLAGTLVARETISGVGDLGAGETLVAFAMMWLLFAGISMLALWFFARAGLRSRALGQSVGFVVVAFFVNFLSLLFDQTYWLRVITPFHYFRASDVLGARPIWSDVMVLSTFAIACAALAFRSFVTRDLTR